MKQLAWVFAAVAAMAAASVASAETINHDKVSSKHDCAKDPTVTVNGNDATVELTGTCDRVALNGNHATVHGSAQKFSINGNDNAVTADSIAEVSINGNRNAVTWRSSIAKTPEPHVTNLGTGNSVAKAK
nr:DUF3060 domain-containing protein [Kofleriaceae bacterium]